VLGKHSGRKALYDRLREIGYNLSPPEIDLIFVKFKELADRKKNIVDEDLEILVSENIMDSADLYHLEYLNVISGTTVSPMASVKMMINGKSVKGESSGNGPIDAAYKAIAKLTKTESEMLRFTISALSGGTDSQGEVTVRLKENGLVALGRGADPDIIIASAKAYINGLNRLAYLKRHPVAGDMI